MQVFTVLYDFIFKEAVRRNGTCSQATNHEVEKLLKKWLYLAADRDGGRKRRSTDKEA